MENNKSKTWFRWKTSQNLWFSAENRGLAGKSVKTPSGATQLSADNDNDDCRPEGPNTRNSDLIHCKDHLQRWWWERTILETWEIHIQSYIYSKGVLYTVYTVLDFLVPVSVDNALRYVVFVSIFTALEKVKPCEKLIVSLSDFSLRSIVIICAFVLSEHLW